MFYLTRGEYSQRRPNGQSQESSIDARQDKATPRTPILRHFNIANFAAQFDAYGTSRSCRPVTWSARNSVTPPPRAVVSADPLTAFLSFWRPWPLLFLEGVRLRDW
ncbi:hypothetical protein NL676_002544 [Syzygium grande]|nr:hypothetical protein NL676_002544 [Syzygium grande]